MKIVFALVIIFVALCSFLVGMVYQWGTEEYEYNGLWSRDDCGFKGHWIHIHVDEMKYEDIVTTCIHEATHEAVARKCENNYTKCKEILGDE